MRMTVGIFTNLRALLFQQLVQETVGMEIPQRIA